MCPPHIAYIVTEPTNGAGPDARAQWREVGALWPQKNGKGWLLVIYPQMSVSGPLVISERKERSEARGDEP